MNIKVKIRQVGNSKGVLLPKNVPFNIGEEVVVYIKTAQQELGESNIRYETDI